jgi:hypothetical protein
MTIWLALNMKTLTRILFLLVLSPHLASADDGELDFLVFVGADYLSRNTAKSQPIEDSDFTPNIDLLLSYNNGPWRLLAEYFATDDENELERLQLGYEFSENTTLWVGRIHQPLSVWNYRYHHGGYLQPSIARPSIENWEDENGVLPSHITGAMLNATQTLDGAKALVYATAIGVAPVFTGDELLPFDILDPDDSRSGNLAGSMSVSFYPDIVGENNIGIIAGYAEIEALPSIELGNTASFNIRQGLLGLQGNWSNDFWRVIAAAYYVDNDSNDPSLQLDGAFTSAYMQAVYSIGETTDVYGRLERTTNEDAPYLQLFPLYIYQRELLGLRWDFAKQQALHLEVSSNRTVDLKFSEYRIQWSAVFP